MKVVGLLQWIGWLAYPLAFPIPLLTLNCIAAWQLQRRRMAYLALPVPPPLWHLPRVWFAGSVLIASAYVVGGFAVLAWQTGVLLLLWIGLPVTVTVVNLVAMRRAYRASRLGRE